MNRLTIALRAALGMPTVRPAPSDDAPRTSAYHDIRWAVVLRNGPFLVGALLVLLLLGVVALGPRLARENPYYAGQSSLQTVDGGLIAPPFPPSPEYPLGSDRWGRDILSLLLYGARNTLVACAFVTMVRLALGLGLGALAGWRTGGLLDRAVMGLVEIISSLPMLLTGMILILALDIRRGLVAFLIALCLVGWGEIAQTVRAEFIALRERPFIEGARVVGVRDSAIVWRHIFPNVLPMLVVVTLMEMGSVLMLLGELAFVGIFIGGGSHTTNINDQAAIIADIPEWGALLADTRTYVRSYPWMVLAPSAAFFASVLGFNLLGEGLRRITRDAGVNTAAIITKRIALIGGAITLATWYIAGHIGPGTSYARLAYDFDGDRALAHAETLVALQREEPGFGAPGSARAAEYIAEQFRAYGVLPAATGTEYLQPVERRVAPRLGTPALEALGADGAVRVSLVHGTDFGEQVHDHGGSGSAEGELVFVGFAGGSLDYAAYRGLDLRGRIAVVLGEDCATGFANEALIRGAGALLVVSEDAWPHVDWASATGPHMETPQFPILRVRPEAMDRLLADSGYDVAGLRAEVAAKRQGGEGPGWFTMPLGVRARVRVELGAAEERLGYNVLGILPGSDTSMDREALLVSTHYDLPEPNPGQPYLSAGDGPAGVGVVLEMLRLWEEQGFRPRRTILFGAWCGGYLTRSGAATYAETHTTYSSLERVGVLHLGQVGSGGDVLRIGVGREALGTLVEGGGGRVGVRCEGVLPARHSYEREFAQSATRLAWAGAPGPYDIGDGQLPLQSERLAEVGNLVT